MLYGLVIAIHIVACLFLIFVILVQSGRGGGLSESFGGSSTQTILGTKTSLFLTRATAAAAVIFIITCLVLGVMTGHRGRSLVSKDALKLPAGEGKAKTPQPLPEDFFPTDY